MFLVFFRYTDSMVFDLEDGEALFLMRVDADVEVLRGVFDGVVDEVVDGVRKAAAEKKVAPKKAPRKTAEKTPAEL